MEENSNTNKFKSTVSSEGQTVIPLEVREYLGLDSNSQIEYTLQDQEIFIKRSISDNNNKSNKLDTLLKLQDKYNRVIVQSKYSGVRKPTLLARMIAHRFNKKKVLYIGSYYDWKDFYIEVLQLENYCVEISQGASTCSYEDYIIKLEGIVSKGGCDVVIIEADVFKIPEALGVFREIEHKIKVPVYVDLFDGSFTFKDTVLNVTFKNTLDSLSPNYNISATETSVENGLGDQLI